MAEQKIFPQAPVHRRLFAMIYDFFLAGVFISIISMLLIAFLMFIKSTGSEAATNQQIQVFTPNTLQSWLMFAFQLMLGFGYLVFFWRRTGKTPGTQAWKMQTLSDQQTGMSLGQAIIRYATLVIVLTVAFLLGYYVFFDHAPVASAAMLLFGLWLVAAWSFFSPNKRMLHEALSNTMSIDLR